MIRVNDIAEAVRLQKNKMYIFVTEPTNLHLRCNNRIECWKERQRLIRFP